MPAPAASQSAIPASAREFQRFPLARPDWQVVIITALYLVALAWFATAIALSLAAGLPPNQQDALFVALIGVVLLWRWLNAVRGYAIQPQSPEGPLFLILRWAPWRTTPVQLSRLREVNARPTVRAITSVALLNMGSLFGWAGPANVPDLGPVLAFAVNARRAVTLELAPRADQRVKTSDGTEARGPIVLVSPRDPAALAAALAPYCASRRPAPAPPSAAKRPAGSGKKRR
jgi:hypothetical protein